MNFKLSNCIIKINFSFLLLLTLALYLNKKNFLLLIISAVIHELSHVVAMLLVKIPIREINVSAFDFEIKKNIEDTNKTFFVLIAGPICNLLIFLLFFMFRSTIFFNDTFKIFFINNLFLFLLNILPIYSLDGGQILYYFLTKKLDIVKSNKILDVLSFTFSLVLIALGVYILIKSRYNYSLLFLGLYLMFTIILKNNF